MFEREVGHLIFHGVKTAIEQHQRQKEQEEATKRKKARKAETWRTIEKVARRISGWR
jgi:hypothetical protein